MKLEHAIINYGGAPYCVESDINLPLPPTFDFNSPEECARLIFACMSNASGGFMMSNCRLKIDRKLQTANLTSSGCHVFYAPNDRQKLTLDQAIEAEKRMEVFELGDVITDQYGGGWERAQWATI